MSDITKKPERLASAIYLISGFFSDQEPLKWKLRNLASELISYSIPFKDNFVSDKERKVSKIQDTVLEICGLFGVAKNAGLVSDMNYDLIIKEFTAFADTIGTPETKLINKDNRSVLSSQFFNNESRSSASNSQVEEKDKDTSELKDIKDISHNKPEFRDEEIKSDRKELLRLDDDQGETKGQTTRIDESVMAHTSNKAQPKPLKDFGAVSVKKNTRQSIIIGLLKRKKEIMIKDVSPLISGCSEKTIQRELLGMVEAGILRKMGEKRWSRYSLIQ